MLVRLAKDQKSLSTKAYLDLQAYLQEIGKMLGGWLKYLNNSWKTIADNRTKLRISIVNKVAVQLRLVIPRVQISSVVRLNSMVFLSVNKSSPWFNFLNHCILSVPNWGIKEKDTESLKNFSHSFVKTCLAKFWWPS